MKNLGKSTQKNEGKTRQKQKVTMNMTEPHKTGWTCCIKIKLDNLNIDSRNLIDP